MEKRLSYWTSGHTGLVGLMALALALAVSPAPVAAQDDELGELCADELFANEAECRLAVSAVRLIQPRAGIALWGGNPVPGTASTLGMRLGSLPRMSSAGRLLFLPIELPPLTDRSVNEGRSVLAASLSGAGSIGLLTGWSPLPTVGGFMSLDALGRASWMRLPGDQGFDDRNVFGLSVGLRLGLLRESLTLPGVSLSAEYGRSTSLGFGTPSDDGHIDGAVANWSGKGALSKRLGPVGLTAGVSYDRYTSDVELSYPGVLIGGRQADAATDRWSAFGNLSWTLLIFHASVEAGWQEVSTPTGLPDGVTLDPTGWWLAGAFRLSI